MDGSKKFSMNAAITEHYFVFATMGEMGLKDVLTECQEQAWVPLLVVRPHDEKTCVAIPCFTTRDAAIKFGKRNLPKNQLFGTVILPAEDVRRLQEQWVEKRGWKFEPMNHPRLIKHIGRLDVEVYEPLDKPDVFGLRGKQAMRSEVIAYAL